MKKLPLILCVLLAFMAPAAVQAQEEEDEGPPPTMVMSQFQCDWNRIDDVLAELQLQVPIWEHMAQEGMLGSAGSFTHFWADEWNVTLYTIGESMEAVVAANEEADRRFSEQHPDANAFAEACPTHRDNFYQFGPVASSEGAPSGGNPALIISMYQCDFGRIGDVFEQYETLSQPVYEAMIEEGKLRGAGTFAHTWASEWNVGFYFVAEDVGTFMDAWNEGNQRIGEAAGDTPGVVNEACPVHKDGIYIMGPRTGAADGDDEDESESEGEN